MTDLPEPPVSLPNLKAKSPRAYHTAAAGAGMALPVDEVVIAVNEWIAEIAAVVG